MNKINTNILFTIKAINDNPQSNSESMVIKVHFSLNTLWNREANPVLI